MRAFDLAIAANDVSKAFSGMHQRVEVLKSLSFQADRGSWTTFIGPSGCGKTTLLRVLAGLIVPDEGEVVVGGREGPGPGGTAYLPQHDTLLPWRTALDNAVLASEIERRPLRDARAEAAALFAHFGLAGFEAHYPSQLSGGMRQRLALVRTFLAKREILLLDEPLGALDPLTRMSLQDWLLDVWSELRKTVVLVTHDVDEALLLSDRVLVLSPRPATVQRELAVGVGRPRGRTSIELQQRKKEILDLILEAA